ncbi:transglutaminase family protein [soil metagenome]
MRYEILHRSEYTYQNPVSIGHHLARLAPLQLPNQRCEWHGLDIVPEPTNMMGHTDYFGNKSLFFAFHGSHKSLSVTAHSFVEVHAPVVPNPSQTTPWEVVRDAAHADSLTQDAAAGEFMYSSTLVRTGKLFSDYAAVCFSPGRPILEAALDLNQRIYRGFKFDPTATDVATPVEEAFEKRAGVCQDFAHILINCLRSLGLPARYVSGYLETLPPPGKVKLVGADASHAWVGLWCGTAHQWMDLDPTNNCIPGERHITVAYGRDFADVSPLRGVVYGSGQQKMKVSVDVTPRR